MKTENEIPAKPPTELIENARSLWMLQEGVAYLNHGSFGAVPRIVFEEQNRWRRKIESEPVEILARRLPDLLAEVRSKVGAWLGMKADDFGLLTNATEGINAVLRSLRFEPGDELLTTNHVYNAVRQAMRFVASKSGAIYREIDVPIPVRGPDEIAAAVMGALSPKTRLVVIDHITSPTALVFPVEQIIAGCASRKIDVMIDGAHAPGMLPLNVERLGAAFYAGNLHKWACGPRGSGFLWVRPDRQSHIHPLVISHFFEKGFSSEFAWQGTRDFSAWLAVPRAIAFLEELGFGRVMEHNHALALWAGPTLCQRWEVEPISPADGRMIGSMVSVPLPAPLDKLDEARGKALQQRLYSEHHIETPAMLFAGRSFVRPCCQIYNSPQDIVRLLQAIDCLRAC